ncbi:hypothetical protein CI610_01525 [invertebrate metagenome]|uniref:Ubiquinone biosynthesis protein UbiV n=1 Tax=invertebrate metagenome TaxID=1711999 RepID=A0A2H9T8H4_9ZZZZ
MKITLGPLLFFWPRQTVLDFYNAVADCPAFSRVYLGEVVCSKRREIKEKDWLDIAQKLQDSGKQVSLSSLTLLESTSELKQIRHLCQDSLFEIEANDMAAVYQLSSQQQSFSTGPSVNIYNGHTLAYLQSIGLKRWVLPVELSAQHLEKILTEADDQGASEIETEVFSYGYVPLAYSARCFTARNMGVNKDQCQFSCIHNPSGIPLKTQEAESLLTINGIQTMSGVPIDLRNQWKIMDQKGVQAMRLSAHSFDIIRMAEQLADNICSGITNLLSLEDSCCNGYWFDRSGIEKITEVI